MMTSGPCCDQVYHLVQPKFQNNVCLGFKNGKSISVDSRVRRPCGLILLFHYLVLLFSGAVLLVVSRAENLDRTPCIILTNL